MQSHYGDMNVIYKFWEDTLQPPFYSPALLCRSLLDHLAKAASFHLDPVNPFIPQIPLTSNLHKYRLMFTDQDFDL